jgi:hypothetical protein
MQHISPELSYAFLQKYPETATLIIMPKHDRMQLRQANASVELVIVDAVDLPAEGGTPRGPALAAEIQRVFS